MFWRKRKKAKEEMIDAAVEDAAEPEVAADPDDAAPPPGTPSPAAPDGDTGDVEKPGEDQTVSGRIDLRTRRVTIKDDKERED